MASGAPGPTAARRVSALGIAPGTVAIVASPGLSLPAQAGPLNYPPQ